MLYTIEEETLTALGDIVRDKIDAQEEIREVHYEVDDFVRHNCMINLAGGEYNYHKFEVYDRSYLPEGVYTHTVEVPNATSIKVKVWAYIDYMYNNNYSFTLGSGDSVDNLYKPATLQTTGTTLITEYDLQNENKCNFQYKVGKRLDDLGLEVCYCLYMEAYGFDAEGNPIEGEKKITTIKDLVKNTKTPYEMIEILKDLPSIPPDVVLTSGQTYGCAGPIASNYIKLFGDTITTNNLTGCNNMFYNYKNDTIPFDINCSSSSSTIALNSMFYNATNLKEPPRVINARPSALDDMFQYCYYLKEIPESFSDTWNWDYYHSYSYASGDNMFYACYSLRRIANNFLKNLWTVYTSTYSSGYRTLFQNCYTLDEIKGLGVSTATYTGNMFVSTFDNCYRLKELTFETNEDGTPKTANWKSQNINTKMFGYTVNSNEGMLLKYNSGITADKKVVDDATYQALKNDPDWYSTNVKYARYNKVSAINTINSLPDTSAYGTNTISFDGRYGSLTDGGAIRDLTAEEIAVASAKGWTVAMSYLTSDTTP